MNLLPTPTFALTIPTRTSAADALALNPRSRPTSGSQTFAPASAVPTFAPI